MHCVYILQGNYIALDIYSSTCICTRDETRALPVKSQEERMQ